MARGNGFGDGCSGAENTPASAVAAAPQHLRGAVLKATDQPFDTGVAAGRCFLELLGVFAEFETKSAGPLLAQMGYAVTIAPPDGVQMKDPSNIVAADLSTPERILLFCLASGTEWAEAGVTGKTETAMVVRGLIDRDAAGRLVLTSDGRAVLDALLGN
jgi:hypothetical protein